MVVVDAALDRPYSVCMPLYSARVLGNREIARDYFQLDFEWPQAYPTPAPGQFFTIRVDPGPVPLLRRPFGFSTVSADGRASTIYWRRGQATRAIAALQDGDVLDVLAPLGRGFPLPSSDSLPVLVAGGVGVGPILYLANALSAHSPAPLLVVGARSAVSLPEIDIDPRVEVHLATDDGSHGYHGTAVALAQELIEQRSEHAELFLCGPHPMLAAGHRLAEEFSLTAWVAMEQMMGCAVGACMGCAIPVHGEAEYARVCTEGPVFRTTKIAWERME